MKKTLTIFLAVAVVVLFVGISVDYAKDQGKGKKKGQKPEFKVDCATIQSGLIVDTKGNPISVGYDQWGYNYQAMMYNGFYSNYSRPDIPVTEDDTILMMKWNKAWLSNLDCDGDGKLDRHFGFDQYIGSGAWLTNHMQGTYEQDGEVCHWTYFVKIVAVPVDAQAVDGIWYAADGTEIGPSIWGAFAIIQELENDPYAGTHGILYKSPAGPGFGIYFPWK